MLQDIICMIALSSGEFPPSRLIFFRADVCAYILESSLFLIPSTVPEFGTPQLYTCTVLVRL